VGAAVVIRRAVAYDNLFPPHRALSNIAAAVARKDAALLWLLSKGGRAVVHVRETKVAEQALKARAERAIAVSCVVYMFEFVV
jgi:hypothetical protein